MKLKATVEKDSNGRLTSLQVWKGRQRKGVRLDFVYGVDGFVRDIFFEGRKDRMPSIPDIIDVVHEGFIERIGTVKVIDLLTELTTLKTLEVLSEVTNIKNIESVDLIDKITEITTVKDIDWIDTLHALNEITRINPRDGLNVVIDLIDLITTISTITSITNIVNVESIDKIDEITKITEITSIKIPQTTSATVDDVVDISSDANYHECISITAEGTVTRIAIYTSHDNIQFKLEVDGTEWNVWGLIAGLLSPSNLDGLGYIASTPQIQLMAYTDNGACRFNITLPINFKTGFKVLAQQETGSAQVVGVGVFYDKRS